MLTRSQEYTLTDWGQHAMAFDSGRQCTVLFGGSSYIGTNMPMTNVHWEFDGVRWQRRSPAVLPPPRVSHAMAYDALRGRSVVFGGYVPGGGYYGDTWEWDGNAWQQIYSSGPSSRTETAMVFDPVLGKVVLFGGLGTGAMKDDMWTFDGAMWTRIPATGAWPAGRAGHMLAYDTARQRIVMVGGRTSGSNLVNETWEWDGGGWHLQAPAHPPAPMARSYACMVYDVTCKRMVMHASSTCFHGALVPAAASVVGNGCSGSQFAPYLAVGTPYLGNQGFQLRMFQGAANAPAVLMLGLLGNSLPLGGGCTLLVTPQYQRIFVTDSYGYFMLPLPLPSNAALRGLPLFAQAGILDPLGPLPGASMTAALGLRLGD